MRNKIGYTYLILATFGLSLLMSCSDDDPVPLRDPSKSSVENQVIIWDAVADSIQTATYDSYIGSEGTFNASIGTGVYGNYWPNAHGLHILVDAYIRTGDATYLSKMKNLLVGIETKNGGTYSNVFNDDMLWLGNACVRAYNATDDIKYKEVAEFLWNDILLSYSEVLGGGITWKKDTPNLKNAVSNGPAIILAMRLYELDANPEYLDWAKKLYAWEKEHLVDPQTELVWDNIKLEDNGDIVIQKDWIFTYNLGTWIGAGLRLYNATGEQNYLDNSLRAGRSLLKSPELTTNGILKDEGQGDGGLFKGVLIRYFTELIMQDNISEADRGEFLKFFEFNAATFYKHGLSHPGMLSSPDWRNAPKGATDLTTQLSGVMLVEAAAKLELEGYFED